MGDGGQAKAGDCVRRAMFHSSGLDFEVTFYFDVFTKEILTYKAANRRGDRNQYIDGLNDVVQLLKGT